MSVPLSKRGTSRCEVIYNATVLKTEIHNLCVRNLGIKNPDMIARKKYMYGVDSYEQKEKYVLEIYQSKKSLHYFSDMLLANTRAANRIKMDSLKHCEKRMEYQELALDNCEMLIAKFQDIVDFFWVDLSKYRRHIELTDKEIALIKKWIQYTNKIKNDFVGGV